MPCYQVLRRVQATILFKLSQDKIATLIKTRTFESKKGCDKYIPQKHIFLTLLTQRGLRSFCSFK